MMFEHTHREKGMWRGWLKNGQSVEISWGKRGWNFGAGVHIHSNDDDMGDRMLFLRFWRITVILPLGIVAHPWPSMDGPQWSAYASSEFGLTFHWGMHRKSFDWPWDWHTLAYEHQLADGSWDEVLTRLGFDGRQTVPYTEQHPYTYTLRNGSVQERTATISKRRHVITYRAFKRLGWPKWIKESIDVQLSDEVGERSGSWKGGTIGCGYDLHPGETMEQALRRMERDRKFCDLALRHIQRQPQRAGATERRRDVKMTTAQKRLYNEIVTAGSVRCVENYKPAKALVDAGIARFEGPDGWIRTLVLVTPGGEGE